MYKEEGLSTRWADLASGGPHSKNTYFSANGGKSDEYKERLADSGRQNVVPQVRMTWHKFGL